MTSIGINILSPTQVHFPNVPHLFLDLMNMEEIILLQRTIAGVYIQILDNDDNDPNTHQWALIPAGKLPDMENAITICFAAPEQNHEFFSEAIELCREISEGQMFEDDKNRPEDLKQMIAVFNEIQGLRQRLSCPEGPWFAIVHGPQFWEEADETMAQTYGYLNAAVAAQLLRQ